jgi:hypothetical protein
MNYDQLEQALKDMRPRQRLYELVKAEMKRRGHWKNLARGWQAKPREEHGKRKTKQ